MVQISDATRQNGSNDFSEAIKDKSQVYIKQKRTSGEVVEFVTGCEIQNKFHVLDSQEGQLMFKMMENSDCMSRQCCKGCYPFEINVLQPNVPENVAPPFRTEDHVYTMSRDFACTNAQCCCPCGWMCSCTQCFGTQELVIKNKMGAKIGSVTEEKWTWCCDGKFFVRDAEGTPIFEMHVTCCQLCAQCCCQDVVIDITRVGEDAVVARMTRKWICKCGNIILDKDEFNVEFHQMSLEPVERLLITSSVMHMKYVYFEQNDQ